MNDLYGAINGNPNDFLYLFDLPDVNLKLNLQSYCPAAEPNSQIRIKSFLIPNSCDNLSVTMNTYVVSGLTIHEMECTSTWNQDVMRIEY